jgi:membrane dipeptidase
MPAMPLVVDAHLDLAHNVLFGRRDLTQSLAALRQSEQRTLEEATVTLPELRRGGVAVAFATLFAMPEVSASGLTSEENRFGYGGYSSPKGAEAQALAQLAVYEGWAAAGLVRLVKSRADLDAHLELWQQDGKTGLVLLMEGADPIRQPSDLRQWQQRGLRLLGLSWGGTRYAGGTAAPGGLSEAGLELAQRMVDLRVAYDASHASEQSFWETLAFGPQVFASHSNCQALVPTDRHLSDAMIGAIGERQGVIGIVLYNRFLNHNWLYHKRAPVGHQNPPVTLTHVQAHMQHIANLIGWQHVGIGSDMDGGLGRLETPEELDSVADLAKIGAIVPPEHADGVLGENWLRFLRKVL